MQRLLIPAAAIALLLTASLLIFWHPLEPSDAVSAPPPGGPVAESPPQPARSTAAPAAERELVSVAGSEAQSSPVGGQGSPPAALRGRFLLPDGSPAEGVDLVVEGGSASRKRSSEFGTPPSWVDPRGSTGPDGSFELSFEPPRAFEFTLSARLEGFADVSWSWEEILPGAEVDVGEVALALGGAIEGTIVDAEGRALSGWGWTARAVSTGRRIRGREQTRRRSEVDLETGHFRIEGMPAGRAALSAFHDMTGWIYAPPLKVIAGETVVKDIVYDGPLFADRIAVKTDCDPFSPLGRLASSLVKVYDAQSVERPPDEDSRWSDTHNFSGLERGLYVVVIDDPRYEPWRRDGVRPGTQLHAQLRGSCAVQLDVRDRETNRAVERFALHVRFREANFGPDEFDVHDGTAPLPGGCFEGLFPGSYVLSVSAGGYGIADVELDHLLPGETRDLVVFLGPPTRVVGQVTKAGRGVVDIEVLLLSPAEENDSRSSPILYDNTSTSHPREYRRQRAAATTDATGRFELPVAAGSNYLVLADQGGGVRALSEPFALLPGEERVVDLVLPVAGRLVGRVRGVRAALPAGMRIWARPQGAEGTGSGPAGDSLDADVVMLGDDGSFEIGPLAPGEITVFLLLPEEHQSWLSFKGSQDRPDGVLELGRVIIPDGQVVRREFTLQAGSPGTLLLRVWKRGEPLVGARARFEHENGGRYEGVVKADAEVGPIPLFAGSVKLEIDEAANAWTYRHPVPITVAAGQELELDVDITVTKATLTFLDADTGGPLGERRIGYGRIDPDWPLPIYSPSPSTTDAEGRLTIALPPGEYGFVLDPAPDLFGAIQRKQEDGESHRQVGLVWTVLGPEEDVLRL